MSDDFPPAASYDLPDGPEEPKESTGPHAQMKTVLQRLDHAEFRAEVTRHVWSQPEGYKKIVYQMTLTVGGGDGEQIIDMYLTPDAFHHIRIVVNKAAHAPFEE